MHVDGLYIPLLGHCLTVSLHKSLSTYIIFSQEKHSYKCINSYNLVSFRFLFSVVICHGKLLLLSLGFAREGIMDDCRITWAVGPERNMWYWRIPCSIAVLLLALHRQCLWSNQIPYRIGLYCYKSYLSSLEHGEKQKIEVKEKFYTWVMLHGKIESCYFLWY